MCGFGIPPIIKVAYQKRLFDDPSEHRKVHKRIIPNFGGIAIFTSFLFSCSLFIPSVMLPQANVLMAAGLILFMTGLQDDIVGLKPLIKFIVQFTSALITSIMADIRITNFEGIFGVNELPYVTSILFTVIFMVGIVNAFNLIDGIDGLAGTLGLIVTAVFAILFYKSGELGWSYMALALNGALIGFLFFNFTPAKIFMGDSGSLILGFVASILSIKFLSISALKTAMVGPLHINIGIGLVLAILIVPIFDTLRVFTLRILRNTSPFKADSNHLHHRLLFVGLSHLQATFVLAMCNLFFIILALLLQDISATIMVGILLASALVVNGLFSLYVERYKSLLIKSPQVSSEKGLGEKVFSKISKN